MREIKYGCVLFLIGVAGCSNAQVEGCGDLTAPPDQVIEACTALLEEARVDDQTRLFALFHRASAEIKLKQTAAALRDLDELLQQNPNEAAAIGLRGVAHGAAGDLPAAIRDFSRVLELDPSSDASWTNRGKALADSGDHARAVSDYTHAIALVPQDPDAHNGRCWSRAVLGIDLDEALEDCTAAIGHASKDGNQFNSRGFVQFKRGDYRAAVLDYDVAIALAPDIASSHYMRGCVKLRLDDASARQDIERGTSLEPGVVSRYRSYGVQGCE